MEVSELPALLKKIQLYDGSDFVRLALQLIAPVFVRTGELMPAQWSEFDLREKLWSIPADRMKMRRPHLIPLSRQAHSVLEELWERRRNDVWVFPGERSSPYMNKNSMLGALKRMGYKGEMTGHGFRGLASTVLNEMGYERAHIEMQLAHAPKNQVEAAYNKALYLPQRRIMMQGWADFLDKARDSAKAGRRTHEDHLIQIARGSIWARFRGLQRSGYFFGMIEPTQISNALSYRELGDGLLPCLLQHWTCFTSRLSNQFPRTQLIGVKPSKSDTTFGGELPKVHSLSLHNGLTIAKALEYSETDK